jgi:hypothetical protein
VSSLIRRTGSNGTHGTCCRHWALFAPRFSPLSDGPEPQAVGVFDAGPWHLALRPACLQAAALRGICMRRHIFARTPSDFVARIVSQLSASTTCVRSTLASGHAFELLQTRCRRPNPTNIPRDSERTPLQPAETVRIVSRIRGTSVRLTKCGAVRHQRYQRKAVLRHVLGHVAAPVRQWVTCHL